MNNSNNSHVNLLARVAIAPMMKWSDRHCRYLFRLLSKHALLYSEMVTTGAILHGKRERFLTFHPAEHPVALQLGGSDAAALAQCAKIGMEYGYDEINLNVGCPSSRVQSGCFGAALMAQPQRVADAIVAMRAQVTIPLTVKTRIGIDDLDSYDYLQQFIATVATAGCDTFIIHARKAWLQGLSPKENREIPPLCYSRVYQLKRDFPHLTIIINGGITSYEQIDDHLQQVDGVMIGRHAYYHPWFLAAVDQRFFGAAQADTNDRIEIVQRFYPYLEQQLTAGIPLKSMMRHLLTLFSGMPGAKAWRRYLSEHMHQASAGIEVVEQALSYVGHC
ncbi:MAG: tRNA dihydrouridine(20/20a) synthase DusA [Gammaproteobacteria bacterium]|nr:tRNA dihydrouridine(20/20a) synthase DusA [Gammaproteobacteria bacterium]